MRGPKSRVDVPFFCMFFCMVTDHLPPLAERGKFRIGPCKKSGWPMGLKTECNAVLDDDHAGLLHTSTTHGSEVFIAITFPKKR